MCMVCLMYGIELVAVCMLGWCGFFVLCFHTLPLSAVIIAVITLTSAATTNPITIITITNVITSRTLTIPLPLPAYGDVHAYACACVLW
mgnify:CR=1 FL=1